jgi:hypothetical protein
MGAALCALCQKSFLRVAGAHNRMMHARASAALSLPRVTGAHNVHARATTALATQVYKAAAPEDPTWPDKHQQMDVVPCQFSLPGVTGTHNVTSAVGYWTGNTGSCT